MTRATSTMTARAGQRFEGRRLDRADVYLLSRQMQSEAIADMTARGVRFLLRTSGVSTLFGRLAARFRRWTQRRRTISELKRLDDNTLRDIGVDPYDIRGAVDSLLNPVHDQNQAYLGDVVRQLDTRTVGSLTHARRMSRDAGHGRKDATDGALEAELRARAANRNQDHTQRQDVARRA